MVATQHHDAEFPRDASAEAQPARSQASSRRSTRSGVSGRAGNLAKAMGAVAGDDGVVNCCGCAWSQASRTLMVSFVLFTTITSAQIAGALISHSMALLADCASMALDAVTYAFNIYADCRPEQDERKKVRNELVASGLSYGVLIGVSVWFLHDGVLGIMNKDWECARELAPVSGGAPEDAPALSLAPCDAGDDVNPYIVFGFSMGGLLFDLLSLAPYCLYGMPCIKKQDAEELGQEDASRMNLMSALLHVAADLMRSTTTCVESILIWVVGINGDKADTYATVAVTATIVFGLLQPCYEWACGVREYCTAGDDAKYDALLVQDGNGEERAQE